MPRIRDLLPLSRHLARCLAAHPALARELDDLIVQPVTLDALRARLASMALSDAGLKAGLRKFKRWALAWITVRDLSGAASLDEITTGMTAVAELALQAALDTLEDALLERYGEPRGPDGRRQRLIVVGMGKLGGAELNVSSDIDLIFVFPEDGTTSGGTSHAVSNFEFFTRLGRQLINAIADVTEDGQVFRVDMRLRPNGDSGPLVCSFEMLETYLSTQGREWERYAWIKARPLTGERHEELEAIRRPFVFRRYLDFGAINAMRELHAQISREVVRKDMADNIKLGPGGIREIEFIAQVFQLIRGGRDRTLQIKPSRMVLALLAERQILTADTARQLTAAYEFLRRLEHRLQYLDDAQTHDLPDSPADRELIAMAMDHADYAALARALEGHRAFVTRQFAAVFADPCREEHNLASIWKSPDDDGIMAGELERLGFRDSTQAAARLVAQKRAPRYQQMPETIRSRYDALIPRVLEAAAATPDPDRTLMRVLDLLDAIARRAAYLALLQQYPQALQKVAELVHASSWAAQYLQSHPVLLDELLDPRLLEAKPDWPALRAQLSATLDEVEPDAERQMDMLREAHHAQIFRLLARDISGLLRLEELSDHLSELADSIVGLVLRLAWRKLPSRHREAPRFAVIGYGKLGGKELGYASDLDLVFIYDDPAADAGLIYGRLATRINTWLGARTAAGLLFETDTRLRPNGESGLAAVSLDAFRKYELESAWVWEHQALTRARFIAGDQALGEAFEQIRVEILRRPRDLDSLKREVLAMRQKMVDAHGSKPGDGASFDIKQDRGGLIDVEFIVQYLILGHAHAHPALCGNLGNIALLGIAADLGLIGRASAGAVRDAYREYRRMQHAQRLDNRDSRVPRDSVAARIEAVCALWREVFDGARCD